MKDGELKCLVLFLFGISTVPRASGIECYVCDSSSQIGCGEFLADTALLEPQSCDNVYDAQYCVKMTQVFEGQLGTKRFCSSQTFGDFCEWVKRPGDENLYQACIKTCSTNACNGSSRLRTAALLLSVAVIVGFAGWLS